MKIRITEAAAQQILASAGQGGAEGMALRIAAIRKADGSLDYAMGFDTPREDDHRVENEDILLIVAPTSSELVDGMTIDYVEMEPGQFHFIFLNPNDPHFVPPKSESS